MQSHYSEYADFTYDFEHLLRIVERDRDKYNKPEQKDNKDNKNSTNETKSLDSQSKQFTTELRKFQKTISEMLDSIDLIKSDDADRKDFLKDAKKYLESLQAHLQDDSKSVLNDQAHTQLAYSIRRKAHLLHYHPHASLYTFDKHMPYFTSFIRRLNKSNNKNEHETKETKSEKPPSEIGLDQDDIDQNNLLHEKAIIENLKKIEKDQLKIKILDDALTVIYDSLYARHKTEYSVTGLAKSLGMTLWRNSPGRTTEQILTDIDENLKKLKMSGSKSFCK